MELRYDKQGNLLTSQDVFIVKRAMLGSGWCCAPKSMTLEQVQRAVDEQCEPYCEGTPWTVTSRINDDPELQSPGLCAECDDRQHWLMLGGLSGLLIITLDPDPDVARQFPQDLVLRTEI